MARENKQLARLAKAAGAARGRYISLGLLNLTTGPILSKGPTPEKLAKVAAAASACEAADAALADFHEDRRWRPRRDPPAMHSADRPRGRADYGTTHSTDNAGDGEQLPSPHRGRRGAPIRSAVIASVISPAIQLPRNQVTARRVLKDHFPYKCCAVCGLQIAACLTIANLDHNVGNNHPDNLARLCQTHHWMYDSGLYPKEAIQLLQAHWQIVKGVPDHKGRMKDAGAKAALTRKRRAAARKAVATRTATI